MKIGDSIKILLSCGSIEEGVIECVDYIDEFEGLHWIILSHKSNKSKKLNIKKKYIVAFQVESNVVTHEERKTLIVDDLSLNEPVADPKLRMTKLAALRIDKSNKQRNIFKKIIEQNDINEEPNYIKYNLPTFIKK